MDADHAADSLGPPTHLDAGVVRPADRCDVWNAVGADGRDPGQPPFPEQVGEFVKSCQVAWSEPSRSCDQNQRLWRVA